MDALNPSNLTEQKKYLIYFKKSFYGFIVAVDPPSSTFGVKNKNPKIDFSLPHIIFITALPMKTIQPWKKNDTDIPVIINECKEFLNLPVLTIDL